MSLFLEPKYIPLVQKPECCSVTCLMMLLYRKGYGLFDQEELAMYFNVRISESKSCAFNVKLNTYREQDNSDEVGGLKTIESADVINQFFNDNDIRLVADAIKISEISNLLEFLIGNIEEDKDLWVEYKTRPISGAEGTHDGLIEGLTQDGGVTKVVIINPSRDYEPRRIIEIDIFQEALSSKFGSETGFIVVSAV